MFCLSVCYRLLCKLLQLLLQFLLGRVALVRGGVGYIKLSRERSVGRSVYPVHCGKTADRIRMPFGIIVRTGPGMRQVVGFGDRSTGMGTFGGEFGARHCLHGTYRACVCYSAATRPSCQIALGRLV